MVRKIYDLFQQGVYADNHIAAMMANTTAKLSQ